MRKLLRAMAKAEMERRGYSKVNRRMMYWRDVIGSSYSCIFHHLHH